VLVGDSQVGKSSLLIRLTVSIFHIFLLKLILIPILQDGNFSDALLPTIGIDFVRIFPSKKNRLMIVYISFVENLFDGKQWKNNKTANCK